jgi:hypothetical protein
MSLAEAFCLFSKREIAPLPTPSRNKVTGHSRQRIPSRPALIKYNTGHVLFESRVLPTSALADCKVLAEIS